MARSLQLKPVAYATVGHAIVDSTNPPHDGEALEQKRRDTMGEENK
jgi:hypothetical protein